MTVTTLLPHLDPINVSRATLNAVLLLDSAKWEAPANEPHQPEVVRSIARRGGCITSRTRCVWHLLNGQGC